MVIQQQSYQFSISPSIIFSAYMLGVACPFPVFGRSIIIMPFALLYFAVLLYSKTDYNDDDVEIRMGG